MSRKKRARPRAPFRWELLAPVALAALGGWWLFTSGDSPLVRAVAPGTSPLAAFRPPDVHALVVAPDDERTILFGSHAGMLFSRDGGATWSRVPGAEGDAMGIAVPPGSKTAYAAGHNVFFRSDDGGGTWRSARPALPGTDIHGFAASATSPGAFYAFVVGHGLFRTEDAGASWKLVGTAPGSTMSLACARSAGDDVLYASTMGGVERSRDGGRTWERVAELRDASVTTHGAIAYAVTGRSLFVSSDGGATWQRREFRGGNGVLVAVAPSNTSLIYVVSDRLEVWRSPDAGMTWERVG